MTLYRHRTMKRPGLPELVGVVILAATVALAVVWWRGANQPDWERTAGHPLEFQAQPTHYNAQDACLKVSLLYEYSAFGATRTGRFVGLWPEVGSPNALPPDRLQELNSKEFPLVVLYDPLHPDDSWIHPPSGATNTLLGACLVAMLAFSFLYGLKIYPNWRGR